MCGRTDGTGRDGTGRDDTLICVGRQCAPHSAGQAQDETKRPRNDHLQHRRRDRYVRLHLFRPNETMPVECLRTLMRWNSGPRLTFDFSLLTCDLCRLGIRRSCGYQGIRRLPASSGDILDPLGMPAGVDVQGSRKAVPVP
jgi:hypothetical protein